MIFDAIIFAVIVLTVFELRLDENPTEVLKAESFWAIMFFLLSSLYVFGTYDLDSDESYLPLAFRSLVSVFATFLIAVLLNYLIATDRAGLFGRGILLGSLLLFFIFNFFYRHQIWRYFRNLHKNARILIFASPDQKVFLESEFAKNKFSGKCEWLLRDSWAQVNKMAQQDWEAWVIAAPMDIVEKELGKAFLEARFSGIKIIDLSQFYENSWHKMPVFHLPYSWFFLSDGFDLIASRMGLRFKRLMDILIASALLLIIWPLMLLTAIIVKLESRGAAIYKQERTGKDGQNFVILKFRSMRTDAESQGAQWAQKNDSRITRVGKLIRLTRLDELPQLWNVLKGDMSFIGPRPERPEFNKELAQKIPYYDLRHLVRPGITGWAQILYPYGASTDDAREKLQYDLFYIKNFSFILDLQIFLKTISVVVLGKGR
jgi:exopolysaccharide biosynthesis polyprenyl glycosylphosphotransferase